ncbi:DUF418 domain-containing protein [Duganella sp. BJB488]|uniref:DUF418 domain-containing protein n=1 Tax=unclassified Duganella TaxID=2636909 RepID=UPI000E34D653|nr:MULTISPECIES: DUF418 domain-containing protein [unclassified Duganella]RFP10478.1 DUF418 domain-containing protein [Duganella sp. BJB489]RFP14261.1 DUF418 domain-containing protein [Duganella sp. BJB488]RFP30198.1 DUF418 domain-containing protein [Duganella sp. BJB480]
MARGEGANERIDAIDILRGVALFGVLMVNLVSEFRVSIFRQFLPPDPATGVLDGWVETLVRAVFEMKAFAVFSFLFGLGLAVQFERLGRTGRPRYWLARRLAVLLVFGLIHLLLIWNGDILTEYALGGLLVLPLLAAPVWALAVAAAGMFVLYLFIGVVPVGIPWPEAGWFEQHVALANQVFASGGFAEIRRFSLDELPVLLPLHIYVFPRTLALFLLGALAWRTGVARRPDEHRRLLAAIAVAGVAGGAALSMLDAAAGAGQTLLAAGYAATVLLLAQRRVLHVFAPLGRMAFTNYIAQSLIFGYIFFGYGLGQFGRLGAAPVFLLGLVVYAAQMAASAWWLRHYRYGPLEWLWRTLMYGAVQPMRVALREKD